MSMWRQLSLGLALGSVVLLASGCQPEGGGDGARSESSSAQASSSGASSSSASSSGTSSSGSPSQPPPSGSAGTLNASWTAPTTNADGSPLTDLASYRLYYGTASTPCPASTFFEIPSVTPSPRVNETVAYTLTGLSAGTQYSVAVTAVDSSGVESACSSAARAAARSMGGLAAGLVSGIASTGGNAGAVAIPALTLTGLTADLGAQVPGTVLTFTATASGGATPYQFKWWLWDGATWTVQVDWSIGAAFTWTASTPNPNYAVGVWVRNAGSTADQPDGYPANVRAYGTISFSIN